MLTRVLRAVKWPDVLRRGVRAYKIHGGTAAFGDRTRRSGLVPAPDHSKQSARPAHDAHALDSHEAGDRHTLDHEQPEHGPISASRWAASSRRARRR